MTRAGSTAELLLSATAKRQVPVPIITARLELRPFQDTDASGIARLLSDRVATRFIGGVKSQQAAAESVQAMREAFVARGWGTLAVIPRGRGDCVGYCGVRPLPHTAEVEIAFALQQECWNLGYATEAAAASIDAAFGNLGITSIVATVYPENKACLRVLEKLAMSPEAQIFGHWPMGSALLFRINLAEWQQRTVAP